MDRALLKRINIISVALALAAIIVFALLPADWPWALIKALPVPFIFILFLLNVRRAVLEQADVDRKTDMAVDNTGKSPLSKIRYWLYIGVLAVTALSGALLWYMGTESSIYGSLLTMAFFLLTFLYLARLIDLSYTAEYFSSKNIRINYGNITIAVVLFLAVGAVVFIYLRYQLPWYFIGITLLFLSVAAFDRTRKTINFLKYVINKPVRSKMDESLKIFNSLAFIALILAYFLYPYLTLNVGGMLIKIGIFRVLLQAAVVLNLGKAILDIT